MVVNGLNTYVYANNNPIELAKLLSKKHGVTATYANDVILRLSVHATIHSNDSGGNYWNPHWGNKWFETDWPEVFVVSKSAFELINWGLTVYRGSLYFDKDEQYSVYCAFINLSIYAGGNWEKKKLGVEVGGSVGRLGYDGEIIDIQLDFLTAKFFCIYEDGKIKCDPGYGWVDFGFSVNIAAIMEYLWGG